MKNPIGRASAVQFKGYYYYSGGYYYSAGYLYCNRIDKAISNGKAKGDLPAQYI